MIEILIGVLAFIVLFDTVVRIWHSMQYKKMNKGIQNSNQRAIHDFSEMYNQSIKEAFSIMNNSLDKMFENVCQVIKTYEETQKKS